MTISLEKAAPATIGCDSARIKEPAGKEPE